MLLACLLGLQSYLTLSAQATITLQKELKEIDRDKASGVTIQITDGNLQKLTGFVEGPKDTAYDGGYFVVDIALGQTLTDMPT